MTSLREYASIHKDWETCAENQRITAQLWHREAYCCLSYLFCELRDIVGEIKYDPNKNINSEDIYDACVVKPSAAEVIGDLCEYDLCEHGLDWYWYETSGPRPYGPVPPKGYLVFHSGSRWYWCEESEKDDKEAWTSAETKTEALESCWDAQGLEAFDDADEAAEACVRENGIDVAEHEREVYEHWAVSGMLGRRLQECGEKVIDFCNLTVWCRCATGQSAHMDSCMFEVAARMGILKGQEHDWSKKD